MYKTAFKTVKKYGLLENGDTVVVGVSGGADSSALLHFLYSLRELYSLRLFAVHVNHGIRAEEAKKDAEFVENLCKNLNVEFFLFNHDIKKEACNLSVSEEEAGREARYFRFSEIAEKYSCNKIAVAHNLNDNCETIIMRLCRGTGLKGLTGIPVKRKKIIRPLIECSREIIEKYCFENNIEFCTDSTNMTDLYTRNKIRLNIIPIMEQINSNTLFNMSNTISILLQENEFIENTAENAFKYSMIKNNKNGVYLSTEKLLEFDTVIIKRVLRKALTSVKEGIKDLSSNHIESILKILYAADGKSLDLALSLKAEKSCGILKLYLKQNNTENTDFFYELPIGQKIYIKELNKYVFLGINFNKNEILSKNVYTKLFDYDKIKGNITLRNRKSGDKISIKGLSGRKKLKDVFMEKKIPKDERNSIPLFACGNNIIWAVGVMESYGYSVCEKSVNILNISIWEET